MTGMRATAVFLLVAVFVATSGCIGQSPTTSANNDLSLSVIADPSQIRSDESFTLFVDVENKAREDIRNITIGVFDIGLFKPVNRPDCTRPFDVMYCAKYIDRLQQSQVESLECTFAVCQPDSMIQLVTTSNVALKTTFNKKIIGTFVVDMLALDEYSRLQRIGDLTSKPASLTFGDNQLQATLEFGKQPPFVAGDVVIAKLNIKNVGPGFIGTLDPANLKITQSDLSLSTFGCFFDKTFYSTNKAFPPITCVFNTPKQIQTAATYSITFSINYGYELRANVPVSIMKKQ